MRWLALSACLAAPPASAQIRAVVLDRPARDFGFFPGDLMTSTARISVGPDTVLDQGSLPAPGPVAPAIDVRQVSFSEKRQADGTQIEVRVTYQSFVSTEQVSQASVPGYTIAFENVGRRLVAPVPGFSFAASVFRHDIQPVLDPAALRPDPPFAQVDETAPARALATGGLATLAGCILLAAVKGWRPGRSQKPFARAYRDLTRLPPDATRQREALLTLHRAFDATAGRRILPDDLDRFLHQHQHFTPLRQDISTFFAASRSAFFGADTKPSDRPETPLPPLREREGPAAKRWEGEGSSVSEDSPLTPAELKSLSRALTRAERAA